VDQVNQLQGYT